MSEDQEAPEKRGPGRPKKNAAIEREPLRALPETPARSLKMRAKPNWENMDPNALNGADKLHVPANQIPEGMSLQWVTTSVFGQDMPSHRSEFEARGWTPVHQEDFDGQFDGKWMKRGKEGEITVDGLVLMARPKELTQQAHARDQRDARNRVLLKEAEMRGGKLDGVTLDAGHSTALQSNKVGRSVERIDVPKE